MISGCSTKEIRNLTQRNYAEVMMEKRHFIMKNPNEDVHAGSWGSLILKKDALTFEQVKLVKMKSGILGASTRYVKAKYIIHDSKSACKSLSQNYVVAMPSNQLISGAHPALKLTFDTCKEDPQNSYFGICQDKGKNYYVFSNTDPWESIAMITRNKACFEYMKSKIK